MFLSFRVWLFVTVSRISSHLPPFRGRTRIFLLLHTWLGLAHQHLEVDARMKQPVRFWVRLDVQSWLQRIAFLTGEYESETVVFLRRLWASRGSKGVFLDIGANVGMISIPFGLMSRDVMVGQPVVVAVEAVPDNVKALRVNIGLNALNKEIRVLESAVGEVEKSIFIQVEGDLKAGQGSGTANILPDGSTYACVRQELKLTTLDLLSASGALGLGCSLIKIDTDGYDLKVLQGATKLLAVDRPVIFGEFAAHCMRWHGQSVDDVENFSGMNGYESFYRVGKTFRFSATRPAAGFVQDLLLVPKECVDGLTWCLDDTA